MELLTSLSVAAALVVVLLTAAYFYLTWHYGTFEAKGLFALKPELLFGNCRDMYLGKISMTDLYQNLYDSMKGHKFGIYYDGREPMLLVRDVDIAKQIMIKDFEHFSDFGFVPDNLLEVEGNDIGMANTRGEEWKALKAGITPAFNLKNMKTIANNMNDLAKRNANSLSVVGDSKSSSVDFYDIVGNYTMDCIAKTVFNIDVDSANHKDSTFIAMGKGLFQPWRFLFSAMFPWLMGKLGIAIFNPKASGFFIGLTNEIIEKRTKSGTSHDDVLGVMMQSRDNDNSFMTNRAIGSTILQFFLDGYDTVASMGALCFFNLATNPEIQERAIEEVDEVWESCDGNVSTDVANELKILDCILSETARLTPFPVTIRRCTKPWTVPGTNAELPEGMRVLIPIAAMQRDEANFDQPLHFDPDRFGSERKGEIKAGTFIPWGQGPRQCIGMRLSRLEIKILLFHVLRKYRLELNDSKTPLNYDWDPTHVNKIKGGCWLRFSERSAN